MVNTLRGLQSASPRQIELMRSYAASELEIWRRVRVPTALPFVFTALKVASVLAMIGAIVGEYFGGSFNALGVLIRSDAQVFDFADAPGPGSSSPRCSGSRSTARSSLAERLRRALGAREPRARSVVIRPQDACRIAGRHDRAQPKIERGSCMKKRSVVGGAGWRSPCARRSSRARRRRRAAATAKLTKVTLQLKWVPQAQFAGYYAALAQGLLQGGRASTSRSRTAARTSSRSRSSRPARRSSASTGCRACSPRATRAPTSSTSPRSSRARG